MYRLFRIEVNWGGKWINSILYTEKYNKPQVDEILCEEYLHNQYRPIPFSQETPNGKDPVRLPEEVEAEDEETETSSS